MARERSRIDLKVAGTECCFGRNSLGSNLEQSSLSISKNSKYFRSIFSESKPLESDG